MIEKGLLVTSTCDQGHTKYRKSNTYKSKCPSSEPIEARGITHTGHAPLSQEELRSKLNQYQVDMLACAGECQEYLRIAEEFPNLKDAIEPMYRSARERSSELMGQLRAINNLMKQLNNS